MRKVAKIYFCLVLFLTVHNVISAQSLRLEATINSLGYYIDGTDNLSDKVAFDIKFKENDAPTWRSALEPSSFKYAGGIKMITGSILQVKSETNYTVKITIIDSFPTMHTVELEANTKTLPEPELDLNLPNILYVSPNGRDRKYSKDTPGAIDTLFKFDFSKIKCGTTIICKGGTYNVGELKYNVSSSPCSTENHIILTSAQNEIPIFDGSDLSEDATYPKWQIYDTVNNIYNATLPSATAFSALMLYDTLRLFPYATVYTKQLLNLNIFYKECLANCNTSFGSGFYRNGNNYFIKLASGENPNGKKITVSRFNNFLSIYDNEEIRNRKFIIKDIVIKNYSKSIVGFNAFGFVESDYGATGLYFSNLNNTIVDNCTFEYNTAPIAFAGTSDSTIIQNCKVKDQTGKWMHGAFKNTALTLSGDINWIDDNGKYGRDLQKSFVFFEPKANYITKNIIIRNNYVDGIISGTSGRQKESSPFQDVDIHGNVFINCHDAIDIVGNAANYRVWNNRISQCPIVFSLIPFFENNTWYSNTGPAYIFRNIVDKSPSRNNLANALDSFNPEIYITYGGCEGKQNKVLSTGLKANTGPYPSEKRTDIHFYHNTMSVDDSLSYNMFLWKSTWNKIISKNNSWNARHTVVNFEDVLLEKKYGFYSINDNYYSDHNTLGVINKIHGQVNTCKSYDNLEQLDQDLREITGQIDMTILKIKGFDFDPKFEQADQGDYRLTKDSPLIDKGEFLNNLSDVLNENYFDNAPDIGALEFNKTTSLEPTTIEPNFINIYPNPTSHTLIVETLNIENYSIIICNTLGQQFKKLVLNDARSHLDVSDLNSGLYTISIINSKGFKKTKMFAKL